MPAGDPYTGNPRHLCDGGCPVCPDWRSLLFGLWPVPCEDVWPIPTCRYCGSETGTPDGQEFVHLETCAWMRAKVAIDAENLSQSRPAKSGKE
jgi:hypothetical protein